jgi:hypothetical protein
MATFAAFVANPLSASAQATQPEFVNHAYVAAVAAQNAFEARMAARFHAHAVPATSALPHVPGGAFTTITSVEQASRDTLPANGAEPDTQTEPDIAIDPADPRIITSGFQQGRYADGGSVDPGYATSQDGGKTWADGNLPLLTTAVGGPFQRASDIAVAYGPDGTGYAQTIPFDATDARSAVAVQRSTDGGLTFSNPVLVVDDNNANIFNDKNWIAVDTDKSSPHYGRIYTVWSRFITTGTTTVSPGEVSWSDDHGQTWSKFSDISAPDASTEGLLPLIHPDGSVTVVYDWTIGTDDFEAAQTSHDGGATWSAPVKIAQFLGAGVPGMRTGGLPAAAADPRTGQLYVTWQDARFNPDGLNDIVLSSSADGVHWTSPAVVNPKVAGLDRFTPAVAATNGVVHVTYRTRGANGTAATVSEDYIASTNRGATFGYERQVGPVSRLTWAAQADGAFLGDYMGLAAVPGFAVLNWCVSSAPPVSGASFHQTDWTAIVRR